MDLLWEQVIVLYKEPCRCIHLHELKNETTDVLSCNTFELASKETLETKKSVVK
jgi:hypothetical protein